MIHFLKTLSNKRKNVKAALHLIQSRIPLFYYHYSPFYPSFILAYSQEEYMDVQQDMESLCSFFVDGNALRQVPAEISLPPQKMENENFSIEIVLSVGLEHDPPQHPHDHFSVMVTIVVPNIQLVDEVQTETITYSRHNLHTLKQSLEWARMRSANTMLDLIPLRKKQYSDSMLLVDMLEEKICSKGSPVTLLLAERLERIKKTFRSYPNKFFTAKK